MSRHHFFKQKKSVPWYGLRLRTHLIRKREQVVVSKPPVVREKPKATAEASTFKKVYPYPNPRCCTSFF
jgi:hypothetical protein